MASPDSRSWTPCLRINVQATQAWLIQFQTDEMYSLPQIMAFIVEEVSSQFEVGLNKMRKLLRS